MKKPVLLCSYICIVSFAKATPTATGIFVEANIGKNYTLVEEFFRKDGQSKSIKSNFFKESNHAYCVSVAVGFGKEMSGGFYVGGKVYASYSTADIVRNEKTPGKIIKFTHPNGAEKTFNILPYNMSIKPMYSYGASAMIGYKVIPNLLVSVYCGVERVNIKIDQTFIGHYSPAPNIIDIICFSQGSELEQELTVNEQKIKVNVHNNGDMRPNIMYFVPGINAKYYLSRSINVGVDASLILGKEKALDAQYFSESGKYNIGDNNFNADAISIFKCNAFIKAFGFRLCLCCGMTF
ncbi:MAG: hypothetical protein LBD36_00345 [Holosporales bacterium]|jgi:hypothetical protein|nr:hypothetical protein [Holosporales bacterium]